MEPKGFIVVLTRARHEPVASSHSVGQAIPCFYGTERFVCLVEHPPLDCPEPSASSSRPHLLFIQEPAYGTIHATCLAHPVHLGLIFIRMCEECEL